MRELLAQVEKIDQSYFGKDRHKQMKQKIDDILILLDSKPLDFSKRFQTVFTCPIVQNKKEKADLLYLRGKSLDFLPEYSKSAEEYLSKAIKLLPNKYEAWDALGHVYWKKRDLALAKKCFEGSLEQVSY